MEDGGEILSIVADMRCCCCEGETSAPSAVTKAQLNRATVDVWCARLEAVAKALALRARRPNGATGTANDHRRDTVATAASSPLWGPTDNPGVPPPSPALPLPLLPPRSGGTRRQTKAETSESAGASAGGGGGTSADVPASVHQMLGGALHLVLEAVTHKVRAARAVCYLVDGETARAVGRVGSAGAGPLPPRERKFGTDDWAHHVLASGIGANVYGPASRAAAAQPRSLLCFPLMCLESHRRLGVVQLFDKDGGTAAFTPSDEASLLGCLHLLSYILQYYPSTPLRWCFDDRVLRRSRCFAVPRTPLVFGGGGGAGGGEGEETSSRLQRRQLVFRTAQAKKPFLARLRELSGGLAGVCRQGEGACGGVGAEEVRTGCDLGDVVEYIGRLEDCWRHSVELNKEALAEREMLTQKTTVLKDDVAKRDRLVATEQERHSEQRQLCEEYRRSYESLASDVNDVMLSQLAPRIQQGIKAHPVFRPRPPRNSRHHSMFVA